MWSPEGTPLSSFSHSAERAAIGMESEILLSRPKPVESHPPASDATRLWLAFLLDIFASRTG